jgi:hypothetical protein
VAVRALGHGLNPLHSAQIGAPAGYSLAWVTTVPPLALLMTPVTLTAGPVWAFSLLVVAAVPVSGWGAFVLCRRLTGKFWASLAGGAAFGFSAFEVNHAYTGQLNLDVGVLLPLIAYLMVAWRDGAIGPRAFVTAAALALTLQAYLFLETFADLTVVLVAGFALGAAIAGRDARRRIARLAGGFVNAALSADGDLPAPVARLMPPPGSAPGTAAEAAFGQYLHDNQIADILVEGARHSGPWPSVLHQVGLNGTTIGGVIVYPVASARG